MRSDAPGAARRSEAVHRGAAAHRPVHRCSAAHRGGARCAACGMPVHGGVDAPRTTGASTPVHGPAVPRSDAPGGANPQVNLAVHAPHATGAPAAHYIPLCPCGACRTAPQPGAPHGTPQQRTDAAQRRTATEARPAVAPHDLPADLVAGAPHRTGVHRHTAPAGGAACRMVGRRNARSAVRPYGPHRTGRSAARTAAPYGPATQGTPARPHRTAPSRYGRMAVGPYRPQQRAVRRWRCGPHRIGRRITAGQRRWPYGGHRTAGHRNPARRTAPQHRTNPEGCRRTTLPPHATPHRTSPQHRRPAHRAPHIRRPTRHRMRWASRTAAHPAALRRRTNHTACGGHRSAAGRPPRRRKPQPQHRKAHRRPQRPPRRNRSRPHRSTATRPQPHRKPQVDAVAVGCGGPHRTPQPDRRGRGADRNRNTAGHRSGTANQHRNRRAAAHRRAADRSTAKLRSRTAGGRSAAMRRRKGRSPAPDRNHRFGEVRYGCGAAVAGLDAAVDGAGCGAAAACGGPQRLYPTLGAAYNATGRLAASSRSSRASSMPLRPFVYRSMISLVICRTERQSECESVLLRRE